MQVTQSSNHLLMVRPANFGFNSQTALSNSFQSSKIDLSIDEIKAKAVAEFDAFVAKLRSFGVHVTVYEEAYHEKRSDAIFPNNWISFHQDGRVLIYPMEAENRRLEKDANIIEKIREEFEVSKVVDLSSWEEQETYLEGTGSIIFDYLHRKAYACRSSRTDEFLFQRVCDLLGFKSVVFTAVDQKNKAIYHTNVMMALGTGYCVICLESIESQEEKAMVVGHLVQDGIEIVRIDYAQLAAFAGNMLEVLTSDGKKLLIMSQTAFDSLESSQIAALEKYVTLVPMSIPTIEKIGGGSTRCMMAAIHLPKKN